jgi:HTH-type transcriptional regulator / antitoxin HipB
MTIFTPHRLGQIIRAYRLEQKLTQAQLAAKSSTGLRFIVELERGKPTVQLGKVIAVADALGLMLMLQKDASLAGAAKAQSTATATTEAYVRPMGQSDASRALARAFTAHTEKFARPTKLSDALARSTGHRDAFAKAIQLLEASSVNQKIETK